MKNYLKTWILPIGCGIAAAVLVSCSTSNRLSEVRFPASMKDAKAVGSKACAECHSDVCKDFGHNIHSRIAKFEIAVNGVTREGCEACHGPGSKHVESGGDTSSILNPAKLEGMESAALCIQCHASGETLEWHSSVHSMQDMACVSCHTVHHEKDDLTNREMVWGYKRKYTKDAGLKKPEPELCFDCHNSVRVQTNYPNHHPIKEGKLVCSDCHNPHGTQTRPMLRVEDRKSELCLSCHMEYTGPYAFEHAPVMEDCSICHNPHGAVSDNLLKQQEPFLCLQCHQLHFHTSFRPNTDALPSTYKFRTGVPSDHSMQTAMMTRCTQCHSMVHGSDLPSLYAPGGGSRLTR